MRWFVYLVRCADDTFYTGVTTDVVRRMAEHNGENGGIKGAKYTKARRPVCLVYKEEVECRSEAQRREATQPRRSPPPPRLPRAKKEKLAEAN
jgi:putative endonuclease